MAGGAFEAIVAYFLTTLVLMNLNVICFRYIYSVTCLDLLSPSGQEHTGCLGHDRSPSVEMGNTRLPQAEETPTILIYHSFRNTSAHKPSFLYVHLAA